MRFLNTLKNDIHFQWKYGFYFLYAFFSIVYIVILQITPSDYKHQVAAIVILSDPAMLGLFFIGALWLLEKGEGLHMFYTITPLRPMEYILSKAISLAIISTLSSIAIMFAGFGSTINYFTLSSGVFVGALIFNIIGLIIASYATSVNHYMMLVILPLIVLLVPPVCIIIGYAHPFLDFFQASALWYTIAHAIGTEQHLGMYPWLILFLWGALSLFIANKRIPIAIQDKG